MSMQAYPEYGFGLIVTGNEIEMLTAYNRCEDEYELVDLLNEDELINFDCRLYDERCEGKFSTPASKTGEDVSHENEDMLVIWAKKQPLAYQAVYNNPEEVAQEMKTRAGKYLPGDFDIVNHLGYFQCTITC